ncbi:MAG: exodeoxyribonuclease V subunit alpha [Bacteroidetes bacterium]|jgi:exodeoxyribonuclease V alpha subunit|nr:exodeoxyribonuclease V subunit alpha [Bacteroidota bacterium]
MNNPTLFDQLENGASHSSTGVDMGQGSRHEQEIVKFLVSEYGPLTQDEKDAVMLTSQFMREGHVCMPVDRTQSELINIIDPEHEALKEGKSKRFTFKNSTVIGEPGSEKPLTLVGNRLYFTRFYRYEQYLKNWIQQKSIAGSALDTDADIKKELDRLFREDSQGINWQKTAAALSLIKPFLIVSGGPGTGKTTTVARMLALQQRVSGKPLRVALAAPTGKAAGRMGEALFSELQSLDLSEDQLRQFPDEAQTIHRLLRNVEDRGLLPPVRKKKLAYDMVVIDEASMIDLSLIYRLLTHLRDDTMLVLLGDKDQLASVEAGSVFADLCGKKENIFTQSTVSALGKMGIDIQPSVHPPSESEDSIVYLTKSYRFDEHSGIGKMAQAVKAGIRDKKKTAVLFDQFEDIQHQEFQYEREDFGNMISGLLGRITACADVIDPVDALQFWKRSAWLTVHRRGMSGSERLNRLTEQVLATRRLVKMQNGWYHGRPVMVTKNDYDAGVFNGDLGVCMRDDDGEAMVYIQSGSEIRRIKPDRLLHVSPAFFLTVHKSQGSEFKQVNLLLPAEQTPILTRELLYTAITRAKSEFRLHGSLTHFISASQKATERFSGLRMDL